MAHRRSSEIGKSQGGGIFSSVFSFVSREFESFVASATGGQVNADPGPSVGRVKQARRRRYKKNGRERNLSEVEGRQTSTTMPGSLFPRTSSLEPDVDERIPPGRSKQTTHQPLDTPVADEPQAGPSQLNTAEDGGSSLHAYTSPWRTRSVSSVKHAVQRFNVSNGAEADFSLRLPSPSPVKPCDRSHSDIEHFPETNSAPRSASRKGKERMQEEDLDLAYIVGIGETSGESRVHVKERELDAARQAQRENERRTNGDHSSRATDERDRDKQRIQILEEEVRRLQEELSRSRRGSPPSPPPPPPPPPPPLPIRIDITPYTPTSMFANARASLRHTSTPVEAPINQAMGPSKAKRSGQPTVNLPSDKMAAFLNELKTVRLRKVGGVAGTGVVAGPSGLSKSVNSLSGPSSSIRPIAQELLRRRSLVNLREAGTTSSHKDPEVRAGQKRKADALGVDELNDALRTAKRRSTVSSSGSGSSSGSRSLLPVPSSMAPSSRSSTGNRTWPSVLTNETDITTPSLCSDNEHEGEGSLEDRAPSTPPGPRSTGASFGKQSELRKRDLEVIDVDMELDVDVLSRPIDSGSTPKSPHMRKTSSELFQKRPPMSPIRIPTPRKIIPPARTRRNATPKPKVIPPPESDEDDSRDSRSTPFLSLVPVSKKPTLGGKGRPRASRTSSKGLQNPSDLSMRRQSQSKRKASGRRLTLDEELRTAKARSSDNEDASHDEAESDDVFIGTGTRSKQKGFLAHGGGGGVPVFVGEGYVRDVDEPSSQVPRTVHKSASQGSLIPRLKGRS